MFYSKYSFSFPSRVRSKAIKLTQILNKNKYFIQNIFTGILRFILLFQVNLANTSIEVSKQNIYRFARILYPPNPEVRDELIYRNIMKEVH